MADRHESSCACGNTRRVEKSVAKAFRRTLKRSQGIRVSRPKTVKCWRCGTKFEIKPRGREPRYCSRNCRQRAYEARQKSHGPMLEALASDLRDVRGKDELRREIWCLLKDAGLVSEPSPPRVAQEPRTNLRVIDGGVSEQGNKPSDD